MAVRVEDIIRMHSLGVFKQIAGRAGNNRIVTAVLIADLAFPEIGGDYSNVREGSFILTGILIGILDDDNMLRAVRKASEVGASGVAIAKRKDREIPDFVINYSDEIMMPLFVFDPDETRVEEVLLDLMSAVREDGSSFSFAKEVERLLRGGLNAVDTADISRMICPGARNNCVVVYIGPRNEKESFRASKASKSFTTQGGDNATCHLVPYRNGIFAVISMGRIDNKTVERIVTEVMDVIEAKADLITTYSSPHLTLEELDRAFREAFYAFQAARVEDLSTVEYNDIGIYKVLVPLKDDPVMLEFMQNYLRVMNSEWLETAKIFVKCKGNYDDAAKVMKCHRNTVRYRIARIRSLVDDGKTEFEFNQNLAMAIKLHLLQD